MRRKDGLKPWSGRELLLMPTPRADISGGCAPPVARTTGEPQLLMLFESYFEPTPRYRGVRAAVVADGKATIGEANATNARSRADAVFRLLRTPAECYRSR
jgi:hypothetical protein